MAVAATNVGTGAIEEAKKGRVKAVSIVHPVSTSASLVISTGTAEGDIYIIAYWLKVVENRWSGRLGGERTLH